MTDTTVADDRANDFATFHATQADMSATVIGRPRGHSSLIDIITYSEGQFTLRFAPGKPGDVAPSIVEVLNPRQLSALLDALQDELDHDPSTDQKLDLAALRAFVELLAHTLGTTASNRFEQARFAGISKDAGGAIVGHLGLGIDTAGAVHDAAGEITFSFQVIPRPPGPFRPLSPADLDSLAAALTIFLATTPRADPLWGDLLTDLTKG
jgi:hypothetical protein